MNPELLETLSKLVWNVLGYLGGLSVVGTLLYVMLKKTLERAVDSRFDARLEKVKHELQLEQEKMSVVYENQKDSLRKVLIATHNATEAIERRIDGEGGDWLPISETNENDFSRVVSEEALFMDNSSDHALRLFRERMGTAVQYQEIYPSSEKVSRAYNQMKFISDRLAEHFRIRVGLEPSTVEPLLDVKLLGACCLINRFHFSEFDMPTRGPLKFQENSDAAQLIAIVRENPELLKSELSKLKRAISSKYSSFFFEALTEVDRYIRMLDTLKERKS